MKFSRIAFVTAALVALSSASVRAADAKFGFQLTVAKPQSDLGELVNDKIGYGLGLHTLIDFNDGHALVPRIDYIMYKYSHSVGAINIDQKANILSVGADYNYFVSGKTNEGLYLALGLGYASGKFEISGNLLTANANATETKGTVYFQGGLGYQFTPNMGAELRYQSAKFNDVNVRISGASFGTVDISAPSIQASFLFRF